MKRALKRSTKTEFEFTIQPVPRARSRPRHAPGRPAKPGRSPALGNPLAPRRRCCCRRLLLRSGRGRSLVRFEDPHGAGPEQRMAHRCLQNPLNSAPVRWDWTLAGKRRGDERQQRVESSAEVERRSKSTAACGSTSVIVRKLAL